MNDSTEEELIGLIRKNRQCNKNLNIRLTELELKQIKKYAEEEGKSLTAYVVEKCLKIKEGE